MRSNRTSTAAAASLGLVASVTLVVVTVMRDAPSHGVVAAACSAGMEAFVEPRSLPPGTSEITLLFHDPQSGREAPMKVRCPPSSSSLYHLRLAVSDVFLRHVFPAPRLFEVLLGMKLPWTLG